MTDQDPTQAYRPPEAPPAPPAAQPPAAPPPGALPPVAPDAAPVPQAVATSPVLAADARRPGRSRARWLVAAVVTLLVAGTAAGATLMLTSSTTASLVQGWAPADTTAYYEIRLDLPGSQRAELAEFMAAFPGFADQAAFPTKLGEIGDRIVRAASEDRHDYQAEIAPWFGGQIGMSAGPMPTPQDMQAGRYDARMLAAISVTDAARAGAWIEGVLKESGATATTETYAETTITVLKPDVEKDFGMDFPDYGYATVGKVILAGDLTSLKAAIDTKGTDGLAAGEPFKAAQAALPGDQLVFFYADYEATMASSMSSFEMLMDEPMVKAFTSIYDKVLPDWAAGALRAQDGRLVLESVMPHVDLGDPVKRVDPIAAMAPADTVFLATGADTGARLAAAKALFDAEPAFDEVLTQVDQALGVVGGFDALAGWIGDAGIVLTRQGEAVDGGLIITPRDAGDARQLFTTLRSLIELGAQGMLTFQEESYGGTTIVTLDLSELAGMSGAMGVAPGTLPEDLTFAYAVADDAVVLGIGTPFVKDVLDARGGSSLADQSRYGTLIDAAGRENAGVFWMDIAAIRGMVEPLLPPDAGGPYEKDIKPYVEPLDAFAGVSLSDAQFDRSVLYLTVTK